MYLRRPLSLCSVLVVAACAACGDDPQVEVMTRIGPAVAAPPADDFITYARLLRADREREIGDPALEALLGAVPSDDAPTPKRSGRLPQGDAPDAPVAAELESSHEAAAPTVAAQIMAGLSDMSQGTGTIVPVVTLAPPTTPAELAALLTSAREAAIDELPGIADVLSRTPAALWPEISATLLAERKARKPDYKALLAVIGGDVPNRYGHFELSWKKAHGHTVKLSEDWYGDLLALPPARVSKIFRGIYRDVVVTAALLRAAAVIGREPRHTEAVLDTLLATAYVHEGTFRDEVGRAIRRLGEAATPGLLRRSLAPALPTDEKAAAAIKASDDYHKAEYARVQLDRMDRLHPPKAIAAVRDEPRLLADLLAAYGITRPEEAAAPLLQYVDAPIPRVRVAAREAFLAYVSGPPPRAERKTVRLLGGRTTDGPARLTYRDFARLAIRERITAEQPDLLEPECRLVTAEGLRDELCEAQPARLAEAYYARVETRRHAREQAQVDDALAQPERAATVAMLDALLADNPELGMRAQLVPSYEAAADEAVAAGEARRAAGLLRKSAALLADSDAERSAALRLRALLIEAEIAELPPQGRAMLLATAESLAPGDPAVHAALARVHRRPANAEEAVLREQLLVLALAVVGGLGLLWLVGYQLRRARPPAPAS